MKGRAAFVAGIFLSIIAFLIGLTGIAILIGVGEATNNTILAYAAVSITFALLAGLGSWIVPGAKWAIVIAMTAPITILSLMGSWSSSYLLPGAIWTIALTIVGAYSGGWLRESMNVNR